VIVNNASIKEFFVGLSAKYQEGIDSVANSATGKDWMKIVEEIPSDTAENLYGWLGSFPSMRKWVGERFLASMRSEAYRVANDPFESTIEVDRFALEDNQLGQFSSLAKMRGIMAGKHPSILAFSALKNGVSTNCYDGQFFFDTDHPKYNRDGTTTTWSNFIAGANPTWYLLANNMGLKPIIVQNRQDYTLRSLMDLNDSRVMITNKFLFGVDARKGVGYGFPQMAIASRAALTADNLFAAMVQGAQQTDENGDPLGIMFDTLVVGPSNMQAAKQTVSASLVPLVATVTGSGTNFTGGNTNVAQGLVDVVVSPYLP